MRKKIFNFFIYATLILTLLLGISTNSVNAKTIPLSLNNYNDSYVINSFQEVADYVHKYGTLPSNFITKEQAEELGWEPGENLWDYAPGKSIGGDVFTNSEESLPTGYGITWHECDINYHGGHRGSDRLVYSNNGLIYGTTDHYQTFTRYY